jgi:hypothetical protein
MLFMSDDLWHLHPQPQEGELLESWLVRFSQANELPISVFLGAVGLNWMLTEEPFPLIPDFVILAAASNVAESLIETLYRPTLKRATGRCYAHEFIVPARGNSKAIVNLKVCSECLKQQDKPHIQRDWNLELTGFCPEHQMPLLAKCPECHKFLSIKLNLGEVHPPLYECHHCRFDLRDYEVATTQSHTQAIGFQKSVLGLISGTDVELENLQLEAEWLTALIHQTWLYIAGRPVYQAFRKFDPDNFGACVSLLEDSYSFFARRINALSILAWIFVSPTQHCQALQTFLRAEHLPVEQPSQEIQNAYGRAINGILSTLKVHQHRVGEYVHIGNLG